MRRRSMSMFQGLLWISLPGAQPLGMTFAAVGNCAALGPLPAVLEVGEGLQQELQSPVAITRLAVGDPKIADVRVNGNQAFFLTGMAPGLGDIPILGAFFRSSSIKREERELLMIVTPHQVQPLAANAKLPSLPGEQLRNYDPGFYRMYFLENGNFDKRSGLSL